MKRKMETAIKELEKMLGPEKVKADDFFRAAYTSEGMAVFKTGMPDAVILPFSVEDIQVIVNIANDRKVPLIPVGGRISGWRMIEVPEEGAIVVDLTAHMNRLIEIDEDNLSVTAEAGATVYFVDKALRDRGYRLAVHPVGQPGGITMGAEVAKCSMGAYGAGIGPVDKWVLGIKAVLGNGDILETGASRMLGLPHFQRYKLPDLTGLFMGSDGGLGIIVEVTEKMLSLPVSIKPVDIAFPPTDEGAGQLIKAVQEIRNKGLFFDMYWATPTNLSYFLRSEQRLRTSSAEEIDRQAQASSYGEFAPEKFGNLLLVVVESIVSEAEAVAREKETIAIGTKHGGKYQGREMAGMMDLPENIWGSKTSYIRGELGQRQNWLYWGTELPLLEVPQALKTLVATFNRTQLPPSRFYSTAYFTPNAGYAAAFVHYYQDDQKEVEEALRWFALCDKELLFNCRVGSGPWFGIGRTGRPYLLSRLKPDCAQYLKTIKDMFDPNNIMNPGVSIWPE